MTHKYNFYYFIDEFNINELIVLDNKINLIFRNYNKNKKINQIISDLKKFCKKTQRKIFISNNLKIAQRYNLDGLYIPSFNKSLRFKNLNVKNGFRLIGSAHNINELKIKEKQGCEEIFISPIFFNKKNNNFLDVIKFNMLSLNTKKNINALGGININNTKRLRLTKSLGIAGISYFRKK